MSKSIEIRALIFSSFQSAIAHDLGYWDPFFLHVALVKQIP